MSKKTTIWVGNLSFRVKEEDLEEEFSRFGKILHLDLPRYTDSGKPKGYAFIEYEKYEDAETAIQKQGVDGAHFDGRIINVEWAGKSSKKEEKRSLSRSASRSPSPKRLRREERSPSPLSFHVIQEENKQQNVSQQNGQQQENKQTSENNQQSDEKKDEQSKSTPKSSSLQVEQLGSESTK